MSDKEEKKKKKKKPKAKPSLVGGISTVVKAAREFVNKPKPKPKAKKDKPRVDAEDVTDAAKREKEIKAQEDRSRTLVDKISSKLGTNMSDAKTKEGKPSKGQMKRKDGSTFGLMGDELLKTQARRNKIEGGLKTAAVGTLLYGADQAGDYKDKKQADKKAAKEKAAKESKKLTPFEKAFKSAKDAGKKTFMHNGKEYTTEEAIPSNPNRVRRTVEKKARGGMAVKSSSSRKSAPRGVGAAKRGYGKAMR